jgi:uncharacterized membrane protein (DUF106 family)
MNAALVILAIITAVIVSIGVYITVDSIRDYKEFRKDIDVWYEAHKNDKEDIL